MACSFSQTPRRCPVCLPLGGGNGRRCTGRRPDGDGSRGQRRQPVGHDAAEPSERAGGRDGRQPSERPRRRVERLRRLGAVSAGDATEAGHVRRSGRQRRRPVGRRASRSTAGSSWMQPTYTGWTAARLQPDRRRARRTPGRSTRCRGTTRTAWSPPATRRWRSGRSRSDGGFSWANGSRVYYANLTCRRRPSGNSRFPNPEFHGFLRRRRVAAGQPDAGERPRQEQLDAAGDRQHARRADRVRGQGADLG